MLLDDMVERYYLKYLDRTLCIDSPRALSKKIDTFWSFGSNLITRIIVMVKEGDSIRTIISFPLYLLNQLRSAAGQEWLPYSDNINHVDELVDSILQPATLTFKPVTQMASQRHPSLG